MRYIYFASSSATNTARVGGPAISSDINLTLPKVTGTLSLVPAVTSQSTTYSATTSDEVILVSASADWTLTLFTAVGNTGKLLHIKKTDSTVFKITIDGNSSETIDGATTRKLCTQYESVTIISDGSNWHVLDHKTITPWTSYTPVVGWTTNNTPTGYWRRNGDSIEVQWKVLATGAPSGTTLSVNIPNNSTWAFDTGKIVDTSQNNLGWCRGLDSGTSAFHGFCSYASSTSIFAQYINVTTASNADSAAGVTPSAPMTFANNDTVVGFFRAPIVDWWE